MNATLFNTSTWAKIMLVVSLAKAFVAGAGLGLAALGIVDVASTLGIETLVRFIQREHVLDWFAIGGGVASTTLQLVWKFVAR